MDVFDNNVKGPENEALLRSLRQELKEWELAFLEANNRKAERNDIKQHPAIGYIPSCRPLVASVLTKPQERSISDIISYDTLRNNVSAGLILSPLLQLHLQASVKSKTIPIPSTRLPSTLTILLLPYVRHPSHIASLLVPRPKRMAWSLASSTLFPQG